MCVVFVAVFCMAYLFVAAAKSIVMMFVFEGIDTCMRLFLILACLNIFIVYITY